MGDIEIFHSNKAYSATKNSSLSLRMAFKAMVLPIYIPMGVITQPDLRQVRAEY